MIQYTKEYSPYVPGPVRLAMRAKVLAAMKVGGYGTDGRGWSSFGLHPPVYNTGNPRHRLLFPNQYAVAKKTGKIAYIGPGFDHDPVGVRPKSFPCNPKCPACQNK